MVPGILCISYIGVYAINAGTFDLLLVAGIGTLGYFLRKFGLPMAPPLEAGVLGNMMEQNLRRALSITDGNVCRCCFIARSPSAVAAGAVVVVPQLMRRLRAEEGCRRAGMTGRPSGAAHRQARRRGGLCRFLDRAPCGYACANSRWLCLRNVNSEYLLVLVKMKERAIWRALSGCCSVWTTPRQAAPARHPASRPSWRSRSARCGDWIPASGWR